MKTENQTLEVLIGLLLGIIIAIVAANAIISMESEQIAQYCASINKTIENCNITLLAYAGGVG